MDERLVMPETRYEAIDGKITYAPPADELEGTSRCRIAALLEAHVRAEYIVAIDLLTRTSAMTDLAPDVSVFPIERDPETGGRRLEELAFQVVGTMRLKHAGKKARALVERGVRRVFAIDVERRKALEWSRTTGAWEILAPDGAIDDRTLAVPLPYRALADAMKADDAIARALLAKKNPVLMEALREARADARNEGRREGKREALFLVLATRGIDIKKKADKRIREERDEAVLERWLVLALRCTSVDALFEK